MEFGFMTCLLVTLTSLLLMSPPVQVHSAKILSVAFISGKSHKITYDPLLYELASRGHDVTTLSPHRGAKKHKNLREIITIDYDVLMDPKNKNNTFPDVFKMKEQGIAMNPFRMLNLFGKVCGDTYDLPHVKALLEETFDLIIYSGLFNECVAGYIYKFNASLIQVSPLSAPSWNVRHLGGHAPPSIVPIMFTTFTQHMTFYERTVNFITDVLINIVRDFSYKPQVEALYREKIGDPNLPSSDEIFSNTSIILSNGHFSLGGPKPFLPDIIEVGGMHCRPAEPLPKDLEDFANSSEEDGFILFSMGSALKGSSLPEAKRKVFLSVFSKLKQNVLWKWETETMPDLPKNVKLSKWLPQQDILGHPKLRAFITHGGFGSITEAVYHGVPLVGFAMYGDQLLNLKQAERNGYAVPLKYDEFNEDRLEAAINKVLKDSKYKENVMVFSKVFRDQPENALDRAVFWTEYVLRHQGALHLRSAARNLNFFQYHSLDVIALLLAAILTILYLAFVILRLILKAICAKHKSCLQLKKKKQK